MAFSGRHKCFKEIPGIGMLMNSLSPSHIRCLHVARPFKPEGDTAFHLGMTWSHLCVF